MERATGVISEIVRVFDLSDATEVLSRMWWRGLRALIENPVVFSLFSY